MVGPQPRFWCKILAIGTVIGSLLVLWARWKVLEHSPQPNAVLPKAQQPQALEPIPISPRDSLALLTAYEQASGSEEKQKLIVELSRTQDRTITGKLIEFLAIEADQDVADALQWALVHLADATMLRQIAERYETVRGAEEGQRLTAVVQRIRSDDLAGFLSTSIQAPTPMEDLLANAALFALREIGSPFAADALAHRLDQATTEADQAFLALALSGIQRPGTQYSLITIAASEQENFRTITRIAAIQALANYQDPESRETLALLAEDDNPVIANAASKAGRKDP